MNQQQLPEPFQQRYEALHETGRFESVKPLHDHRTDTWTAKAWIQPDGAVVLLDSLHFHWILKHSAQLTEKFGLTLPTNLRHEQDVRVAAVRVGFFRVNYHIRTGSLLFEGLKNRLSMPVQEAMFVLGVQSIHRVSYVKINLFDDAIARTICHRTGILSAIDDIGQRLRCFDELLVTAATS
jgi:hypothetical protein